MSISTAQKKNLNKMNRAAKDVSLGTMLQKLDAGAIVTASAVVVTSAQASASLVSIDTGRTGLIGEIVSVKRSGSTVGASGSSFVNIKVLNTGSALHISSASSASCVPLAAGDIVSWIAF